MQLQSCARRSETRGRFAFQQLLGIMARLRTVRPRLKAAGADPRLAAEGTRDQRRVVDAPWRRWYRTARWRALRLAVLQRDQWRCRQTGVLLVGRANAPDAPVVDHIEAHRGDAALFWDISNLQAVAKVWHDGEKQRSERRGGG